MKNIWKILAITALAFIVTGCGSKVEVPSAHLGKVMNSEGYKEDLYLPSRFRLDPCMWGQVCETLVIADVSDRSTSESFKLVMPQDRLEMDFELDITYTVDRQEIEELFDSMPVTTDGNGQKNISIASAYATYARPVIMSESRNFLSRYSIEEITTKRTEVSYALREHIREMVESQTPFLIHNVGMSQASPPPIIIESQLNTAKHHESIRLQEQEQEIDAIRLQRQLDNENMRRRIEVEKAEATSEVNKILGEGYNENYERYRMLEIMDNYSKSDNKMIVPMGMLDEMATQFAIGNELSR